MCKSNGDHNCGDKEADLKSLLADAQTASAILRTLHYSWIELAGAELEAMLELSSKYADSVTRQLAILNGDEEVNHD